MWVFLDTSHAPITANDNLANKQIYCLCLLDNLSDLLIQVDAILTILGIFDPLSPSIYGIPIDVLDDFLDSFSVNLMCF